MSPTFLHDAQMGCYSDKQALSCCCGAFPMPFLPALLTSRRYRVPGTDTESPVVQGGEVTLPPKREVFYLSQRPYLVAGRCSLLTAAQRSGRHMLATFAASHGFDALKPPQQMLELLQGGLWAVDAE